MIEFEIGQKVEVSDDGVWIIAIIQKRSPEEGKWVVKFDGIIETKKSAQIRPYDAMAKLKAKMEAREKLESAQPWLAKQEPLPVVENPQNDPTLNPFGFKAEGYAVFEKIQVQIVHIDYLVHPPKCEIYHPRQKRKFEVPITTLKPEPDWVITLKVTGAGMKEVNGKYELDAERGKYPKYKHTKQNTWIVDAGGGRFWNIRQGNELMYQVQSTDRTLPLQCWNELRGRAFRAERPLPTVTVFDKELDDEWEEVKSPSPVPPQAAGEDAERDSEKQAIFGLRQRAYDRVKDPDRDRGRRRRRSRDRSRKRRRTDRSRSRGRSRRYGS